MISTYCTYLDEELNNGLDDVGSFPVHPYERRNVSHVQVSLVVDELVENTDVVYRGWGVGRPPSEPRW